MEWFDFFRVFFDTWISVVNDCKEDVEVNKKDEEYKQSEVNWSQYWVGFLNETIVKVAQDYTK